MLLHPAEVSEVQLPHLAIRPYPSQYMHEWTARDGTPILIRPIRAEDEPLLVDFHATLSDRSVYLRFLHPALLSDRSAHERLSRLCHVDYDREFTLVADRSKAKNGELRILGASRMTKLHGDNAARFSLLINDQFQGLGIGLELVQSQISLAKKEGLERLEALMSIENRAMQHLCSDLGFNLTRIDGPQPMIRAELKLSVVRPDSSTVCIRLPRLVSSQVAGIESQDPFELPLG